MPMKNTGKQFEELTEEVFKSLCELEAGTEVTRDVKLDSADGPRQFDVVVKSKVAGLDLVTVVECRDFSKKLTVTHVDALHSKMIDVKANKAVLVSKRGFSGSARKKAHRLGITLCTLNNPMSELDDVGKEMPIAYVELKIANVYVRANFKAVRKSDLRYEQITKICDRYIHDVMLEEYMKGKLTVPRVTSTIDWAPSILERPLYLTDISGGKHDIQEYSAQVTIEVVTYFGYSRNVSANLLQNSSDNRFHVFVKADNVDEIKSHLAQY